MTMFPKRQKTKQNKDDPSSITSSPGCSPSHACPPYGMYFKRGLRAEERKIFMFIFPIDGLPGRRLHIPEFCKPQRDGGRAGCGAYPAMAPGLEKQNITGLASPLLQGRVGPSDGGGKEIPSYPTPPTLEERTLHS